jgi:hypothetical protein
MSLIYNALKEQDSQSGAGISSAVSDGYTPRIHPQSGGLSKSFILTIVGGLLTAFVLIGYSFWPVNGLESRQVTKQFAISLSSAGRPAAVRKIINDDGPDIDTTSVVVPKIESSKLGKDEHAGQQVISGGALGEQLSPPLMSSGLGLKIAASKEKTVVVPHRTLISAHIQDLAATNQVVKQSVAVNETIVPAVAVKNGDVPQGQPHRKISAEGIVAKLSVVPKNVTIGAAKPTTARHESAVELRATRDFLREVSDKVAQLKVSMRGNDTAHTESLLQSLEHLAGADSVIVLRIRAYWLLQQHKNTLAQNAYQKLLTQQPDDMPANLNMALLELRAGNHKQALERVSRMALIYPDSGRVRKFKHQLRVAGGR